MDTGKLLSGECLEESESDEKKEPTEAPQPAEDKSTAGDLSFGTLPDTDLSATLGAFSTRIQRKKKEHARQQTLVQRQARVRHSVLLEALMNIRKSLSDVARTDLGERFHFTLEVDDWHGWPRLCIQLNDWMFPELEYPNFAVQAHDRKNRAVIEIFWGDPDHPERIPLMKEADIARLPVMLKRCVRTYLDLIADIVIKAEKSAELDADRDAARLKNKETEDFQESANGTNNPEISDDLYEEDFDDANMLEALPSLDDLDALPGVPSLDTNEER